MISLYAGALGTIMGISIAWTQLNLPRPATYNEVQNVQQYASATREIVLNQEWFRLKSQLREAQVRLSRDPGNRSLIQEVTRLEQSLRAVESDLSQIR